MVRSGMQRTKRVKYFWGLRCACWVHGKYPKWSPGVSRQKTPNVLWVNYESVDTCVTATAFRNLGAAAWQSPHPFAWAPGEHGPIQIHVLQYKLLCRMALDRATPGWENTSYCFMNAPPGITKPSPYHWLAIMSKNRVIYTKLQLLLGKHYE